MGKQRNIIVSGGYGYLGRKLIGAYKDIGANVSTIVRERKKQGDELLPPDCRVYEYDGSLKSLHRLAPRVNEDTIIIHTATSYAIERGFEKVNSVFDSNIKFGSHLLKLAHEGQAGGFLNTESYWQFDAKGQVKPMCLYSASKASFSSLVEYYGYNLGRVTSLVLYDVYGEDDTRGKFLNMLLNSGGKSDCIPATSGEQVVDYVHIDDVVEAFMQAGKDIFERPMGPSFSRHTVRSGRALTLARYILEVEKVLGLSLNVNWGELPYPPHQIMLPWLPSDQRQVPNWRPKITFADGIRRMSRFAS